MTNNEIRQLQAKVEVGVLLDREEQLLILQQLRRANGRIMDAVRAGYPTLAATPARDVTTDENA